MAPSRDDFRKIMGSFATGVTVITTNVDGRLHGMTASAFASLSLEPLLVLVCVDKTATSHDLIARSGCYAVNILPREQEHISNNFARKDADRQLEIADLPHRLGVTGAPLLEGCIAYVDCRVVNAYDGGDHTIYVGQVEDGAVPNSEPPLIFFRGRYMGVDGIQA